MASQLWPPLGVFMRGWSHTSVPVSIQQISFYMLIQCKWQSSKIFLFSSWIENIKATPLGACLFFYYPIVALLWPNITWFPQFIIDWFQRASKTSSSVFICDLTTFHAPANVEMPLHVKRFVVVTKQATDSGKHQALTCVFVISVLVGQIFYYFVS